MQSACILWKAWSIEHLRATQCGDGLQCKRYTKQQGDETPNFAQHATECFVSVLQSDRQGGRQHKCLKSPTDLRLGRGEYQNAFALVDWLRKIHCWQAFLQGSCVHRARGNWQRWESETTANTWQSYQSLRFRPLESANMNNTSWQNPTSALLNFFCIFNKLIFKDRQETVYYTCQGLFWVSFVTSRVSH